MPSHKKKYLKAKDFEKALKQLDHQMTKSNFLTAFAPIDVVTIGGFLAVTYFKNREATGDLDYMIDPQWAQDDEIKTPFKEAIESVAEKEKFEDDWMNDELRIWTTPKARETIFARAYQQNILLFDGQSLRVWAAPLEWALERKIRRVAFSERGEKKVDMEDALVLFKHFREANKGPLDMEYFRNLNMNGFDSVPEPHHMEKIGAEYRDMYDEDLFFSPTAPAASYATSSYPTIPAVSSTAGPMDALTDTHITQPDTDWTQWEWTDEHNCNYRWRMRNGEVEYDYDTGESSSKGKGKEKKKEKK